MGDTKDRQISHEEALTAYCTFLERLHYTVETKGEAFVLQRLVEHPGHIKIMQDAYMLLFLETSELSKLSPEFLVGFESWGLELSALIKLNLPPAQRHGWWHDLAENVPSAYIDRLLKAPHPFYIFENDLYHIEICKLCSGEIVHRSEKHPEVEQVLRYKTNTPEREAREYLRGKDLPERARLADKYGLKGFAQFERNIHRGLTDFYKGIQKKYGLKEWIEKPPVYNELIYKISTGFPKYEEKVALILDNAEFRTEGGNRHIDLVKMHCKCLETFVAIDKYGLLPIKERHLQKFEADKTLSDIYKIINARGIAKKYKWSLDGGEFPPREGESIELRGRTENEAFGGVWEGADSWAGKDVNEIIVAGLTSHLTGSIRKTVKSNLINAGRQEDPQFAKLWAKAQVIYKPKNREERWKLQERVKNLMGKIERKESVDPEDKELLNSLEEYLGNAVTPLSLDKEIKGEDGDSYCLGDVVEDKKAQEFVETIEDPIDLKGLGLNIDELTINQYQVLIEIADATTKDIPLPQYWGKDYARKKKMHERMIKTKLKKP